MGLLDNYKKSEVVIKKEKFKSTFDYSQFNFDDKEHLIELEKKALHTGTLLKENLKELGDVFLEAKEVFSNNKNGMFGKWYESLGFKRDFVYLCLDRRVLSLQYTSSDVYELPDRVIKEIKKIEKPEDVVEILEAENPKEKLREFKESHTVLEAESSEDLKKEELKLKLINISKTVNTSKFTEKKLERLEKIISRLEKELA
ncbi:MAG: hypothetical protein ACRDAT_01700 [Cetobacterium sp.]